MNRFIEILMVILVIISLTGCKSQRGINNVSNSDNSIEGKKWILTELMGQKIDISQFPKPAFIQFDKESGKVSGTSSCNNFFGPYELLEGNRIKLGDIASTMMACPEGTIEGKFFEMLSQADNYTVNDSKLTLNKAKMAPLAVFENTDGE